MCAATSESTPDGRDGRGPITDAGVAAVLRPFVRATRPLLRALRASDPLGLQHRARRTRPAADERKLHEKALDRLADSRLPGTAAWAQMDADERAQWWGRPGGRPAKLRGAVPA